MMNYTTETAIPIFLLFSLILLLVIRRTNIIGSVIRVAVLFAGVLATLTLFAPVLAVPDISGTKLDILTSDQNANNMADPGDSLLYQIEVDNFGTTDATGVQFQDTVDINTTYVPGSLRTSPIARNDSYSTQTDVALGVGSSTGVLVNDTDPDGRGSITVVNYTSSSANGGTVNVSANGAFEYGPPTGFAGVDTFEYAVQDIDGYQDTAVVAITVMSASTRRHESKDDFVQVFARRTALDPVTSGRSVVLSGETITIDAGVMNPGQRLLILFVVTIDDPFPNTTNQVCNQGVITGDNFVTELTSDSGGSYQSPTCTAVVPPPNQPPVCNGASPSVSEIWPANAMFVSINVLGVTDSDGDSITITIDSVYQDEPVTEVQGRQTSPDGQGVGTTTASVRAERAKQGNGRVYHIAFTARDSKGGQCSGNVTTGVPTNPGSNGSLVDDGALYDSTAP